MPVKVSNAEMVPKTAPVSRSYTDEVHAYLLSLLTTPTVYRQARDRFIESLNGSLQGDPEKVAACEADRKELNRQHLLLLGLAKLGSTQDPTVPEKLGLGPVATKTSAVKSRLAKPENFKLKYGSRDGEMMGTVSSVKGAKMFEIWGCMGDPNLEENWTLLAAAPNCTGIVVKGLIPGTKYWFRIRAMRHNELGPWSNYITLRSV
ncbi:fibronectin type III domain-containing protein [Citrifermentans bremense]|uniref:fibronectin type III domain-containing protein n=1 Tax=Citrifermentans bremense TaxID=60035 RepID=UPI00047B5F40|nr:fibronectin type III domain-containing protein [Citrifermentans bremense]